MKKAIICILAAVLLLHAVGVGVFVYHTRYETALIDEVLSPNGEYTLTLSSVGKPDWPFGSAHGRITLTKNGKKLSKAEIDLAQDGCQTSKENWSVVWYKSYAQVSLHADEQEDEHWQIYFDGRTVQVTDAPVRNETALSDLKAAENENG